MGKGEREPEHGVSGAYSGRLALQANVTQADWEHWVVSLNRKQRRELGMLGPLPPQFAATKELGLGENAYVPIKSRSKYHGNS